MPKMEGFVLAEIVIVIIVVGVLAVMPLIFWPGTTLSLDATARQMADDIRYAQALAMARSERYRVVGYSFSSYQIQNSTGTAVILANGKTTVTFPSGFYYGAVQNINAYQIVFNSDGTPYQTLGATTPFTPGVTYSFVITDGTNQKQLSISPITGRVIVQ